MLEPATADDHLYEIDGDRAVPSPYCQGPWDRSLQHGGPVSGLLAWAAERQPAAAPMRIARITVDLFRGVPMRPLTVTTAVRRDGRRIQAVDVSLLDDGLELARASVLRIRTDGDVEIPEEGVAPAGPAPQPDDDDEAAPGAEPEWLPGFVRAVDMRNVVGYAGRPGPRFVWCRLRCPVVAGEKPSAVQALVALSDYASGLGNPLDFFRYTSINPDISLHVARRPVGEWVGIDAVTHLTSEGIGMSEAALFDIDGQVGRVSMALVIDRRR